MQIIEKLENCKDPTQPVVLTIGNFDGMHRGHCKVLKRAQELAGQEGQVVVITFRNHPSIVLSPDQPTLLLCTLAHKLYLLQQLGIPRIVLLPFTRHLAKHSARSFIEHVRQFIPFSHLVLGHDATLGRDRQGDRQTMQKLGLEWGFQLHYLDEYRYEGKPVSSTRIRQALQEGDLSLVEEFLNRPYSIYGTAGKGKHSLDIDISGLCLPPFGTYSVEVKHPSRCFQGIANLGVSSIIDRDKNPILELLLSDSIQPPSGENLEVVFKGMVSHS